jgi:hypothetical protein
MRGFRIGTTVERTAGGREDASFALVFCIAPLEFPQRVRDITVKTVVASRMGAFSIHSGNSGWYLGTGTLSDDVNGLLD